MILDIVGAPYFQRNMDCLSVDGRLIEIAVMQGAKVDGFNIMQVMAKCLTITGSTLRPRTALQKAEIAQSLYERVWPLLDAGRCTPVIHGVFSLSDAGSAHALMESSQHIGKIMLQVAG